MANGNVISGSSGGSYRWYAVLTATQTADSATSRTYRVELAYYTRYAIHSYANGSLSGAVSGTWNGSLSTDSQSGTTTTVLTKTLTVSKGSKATSKSITGRIQVTGGFGNGTSTAKLTLSIPAIDYSKPAAPTDCSASRSSDSRVSVSWTNGSTSTTAPRSSTKVERQVDGGGWAQVASATSSAKSYTDNSVSANHRYRYRVRAYGAGGYSGYATSGYVYTTPAAPGSVTASKTSDSSVSLSIDGAAPYATSYDVERTADGGGSWQSVGSAASWPYEDADAPAGTVTYRVRAVRGSLKSAWAQSNSITTIAPPAAPTVELSPSGPVVPTGTVETVLWVPSHPDGSEQTAAQVEWSVDGSATTTDVTGSTTHLQLPDAATDSACTLSVRVRTKGLDPDWGAWSSSKSIRVAVPPSVVITAPASDGDEATELPVPVAWQVTDSTGVAAQTVTLLDANGDELASASLGGSVRSLSIDDSFYPLENLSSYTVRVFVRGGSSLTASAERDFSTNWAEPAQPVAFVEYGDGLSASVTAIAGEPAEGQPDVEYLSVTRVIPGNGSWQMETNMASGSTATDPLPPLNTDFSYIVTAYALSGAASTVEVPARIDSLTTALNFGSAAGEFAELRLNPSRSRSVSFDTELFDFADGGEGGGLPVAYSTGSMTASGSEAATVVTADEYRELDRLARAYPTAWVRDPYGGRSYCAVSFDFDQKPPYGVVDVTVSADETRFREAW